MKTFTTLCLALLAGSFSAFAQNNIGKKIQVIIENPWLIEKTDEPVVIDLHTLKTDFTENQPSYPTALQKCRPNWMI